MTISDQIYTINSFLNSLFSTEMSIQIIHFVSVFLLNLTSYAYILLKFYKVLCYSKMTFEWLPMINPYWWPFSVFNILTGPYFAFWARILPSLKIDNSSIEISGIIALESLNSIVYFCIRFVNILINILTELEDQLENSLLDDDI